MGTSHSSDDFCTLSSASYNILASRYNISSRGTRKTLRLDHSIVPILSIALIRS